MLTSLNVIIVTDGNPSDDSVFDQSSRAVGLQSEGRTTAVLLTRVVRTVRVIPVFANISNIIYCPVQRHATSVLVGLVSEVKQAVVQDETSDSARNTDRKSVTSG
jgi:hypothetical protein